MATWPATLPQVALLAGFSLSEPDTVIRSKTTIGPPLTRRFSTAGVAPIPQVRVAPLTLALRQTLSDFFRTDCAYGAEQFTWASLSTHTGGGTGQFLFLAPIDYTPQGRGLWIPSMQLVRLP